MENSLNGCNISILVYISITIGVLVYVLYYSYFVSL